MSFEFKLDGIRDGVELATMYRRGSVTPVFYFGRLVELLERLEKKGGSLVLYVLVSGMTSPDPVKNDWLRT